MHAITGPVCLSVCHAFVKTAKNGRIHRESWLSPREDHKSRFRINQCIMYSVNHSLKSFIYEPGRIIGLCWPCQITEFMCLLKIRPGIMIRHSPILLVTWIFVRAKRPIIFLIQLLISYYQKNRANLFQQSLFSKLKNVKFLKFHPRALKFLVDQIFYS